MTRISLVLLLIVTFSTQVFGQERPFPVTVALCGNGLDAWYLSINSRGEAELIVDSEKRYRADWTIPQDEWTEFAALVKEVDFFDLDGDYGQRVPDGGAVHLTIAGGRQSSSVNLYFLMNYINAKEIEKLREPARVLRLLTRLVSHIESDALSADFGESFRWQLGKIQQVLAETSKK